jgi:hypothetical protein
MTYLYFYLIYIHYVIHLYIFYILPHRADAHPNVLVQQELHSHCPPCSCGCGWCY